MLLGHFGLLQRVGLWLLRSALLFQRTDRLVDHALDLRAHAKLAHAPLQQRHQHRRSGRNLLCHRRDLRDERAQALHELHSRITLSRPIQSGHRVGLDVYAVLVHLLVLQELNGLQRQRCVGRALDVAALDDRLGLEVLADDLGLDAQSLRDPVSDVELLELDARGAELGLDLLSGRRLAGLGVAAHDVGDAQHLVDLLHFVLAVLTQVADGVDHLVDRNPIDLALDAALFSKHRPVVHRDQLVLGALVEHALDALGALVVHAHDLGRTREPSNPRVDLVQLVELILRKDVICTRHEVGAGDVGRQRLGAREERVEPQWVIFHVQDHVAALGVPVHLAVFLAPDLKHLGLVPRVVLGRLVVDLVTLAVVAQRHLARDRLAKALLELVFGHEHATRHPAHLMPCAGRTVEKVLPVDVIAGRVFVDDALSLGRWAEFLAKFVEHGRDLVGLSRHLVTQPDLARAHHQPVLNALTHRRVPG